MRMEAYQPCTTARPGCGIAMRHAAAVSLACAFVGMLPLVAAATDQYTCALREGCGTSDCGGDAKLSATLDRVAEGWQLSSNGDVAWHFSEIGQGTGARHFVSTDIDAEAGAAALLTIFDSGTAYLSLHGTFLVPLAETYTGQCALETS